MTNDTFGPLKKRLATISDVYSAASVLAWDRQTYMPEGGVRGRAEQLASLARLAHEMLVSPETGELLDGAGEREPGSDEAAFMRLARREHGRAIRLPARLVAETSRATALAEQAWIHARNKSDWSLFAPHMESVLALKREEAHYLDREHPYDAMLDRYDPGASTKRLQRMFDELKAGIVPLVRNVSSRLGEDRSAPLRGEFDEDSQDDFGRDVISSFGYDWSRGRQDRAVHPFCINFGGPGDVRITTRLDPGLLSVALFATCHEAGHALYEQGVDPKYSRTPLSGGVSMGVHESQSRLWENLVARSRPFWSHFHPRLRETFPSVPDDLETMYRAVNAVRPSEIRTEADELTYDLHVLLRFELEVALFEQDLSVSDLPEAWNAKMEEYLGIVPENDALGVLQDTHWAIGYFGYFPAYTVGNVLSVQLFEAAVEKRPEILPEMERGEFGTLLGWLRENVHRHGKKYEPDALIERATGRPPDTGPYLRYLKTKFGELYGLK
ncbi:MAG TPA: carboxypeptidase M32 [Rubrobacter sp.]|nr:carboxypeptidase M32 [Rubrobacter sp.]